MKEGNKQEKTLMEQRYDILFEKDENGKALNEDDFLNRLIDLESAGKIKLFRTLLGDKTKEEVRAYLQSKSREDREKIIGKDNLGKEMTIGDVIDKYSKMVKNMFKSKPIKQAIKEQGIECQQVDGMILPPEGPQRLLPGSSEGGEGDDEKKTLKFKEYQEKSPILFGDILTVENGIFPGDIIFFEGTNEKNALRYTGYVAIQIPKLNKTIFINDMKGEATFVCDKLVSEEDMKKSKKRLSKELGDTFHSVIYLEDKKELWKLDMLDLIFGPEQGSRKIVREALMNKNGELTEMGKIRFNSNTTVRSSFKLSNGIGYIKIAGIFGVKRAKNYYLQQDDAFYELSVAIFGEDNENVKKLRQKIESKNRGLEQIRKELIERENERFNLKTTALRFPFKLSNGIGYAKLAGIFGVKRKIQNNLIKDDAFYELSAAIFGEDNPKVIELKKLLMSPEEIKAEIFQRENERFNLKTTTLRFPFKLSNGIGYTKLAGIFGVKRAKIYYLQQDDAFYELSVAIFGEDNENVKKLKEKMEKMSIEWIKTELKEKQNERFSLNNTKGRAKIKLSNGIGYIKIAGIFGVIRDTNDDLYKDDAFYELSVAIFGKDNPNVQNLKKLLMSPEEIKAEIFQRQNERFGLNCTGRKNFKLSNGIGYIKIAGIFGVIRDTNDDLYKDDAFYELSVAIFGKDNPNVQNLKKLLISPEEIKAEIFQRQNERFGLNCTGCTNFKLSNGIGYIKIAGIFGVIRDTKDDLYKDDAFYELSVAIFGEDNENVKKLKEKIGKMSIEWIKTELKERQNERFSLNCTGRTNFKLSNGIGYIKIAGIFGVTRDGWHKLYKDDAFYELSVAIFGEDNENVKKLKEKLDKNK